MAYTYNAAIGYEEPLIRYDGGIELSGSATLGVTATVTLSMSRGRSTSSSLSLTSSVALHGTRGKYSDSSLSISAESDCDGIRASYSDASLDVSDEITCGAIYGASGISTLSILASLSAGSSMGLSDSTGLAIFSLIESDSRGTEHYFSDSSLSGVISLDSDGLYNRRSESLIGISVSILLGHLTGHRTGGSLSASIESRTESHKGTRSGSTLASICSILSGAPSIGKYGSADLIGQFRIIPIGSVQARIGASVVASMLMSSHGVRGANTTSHLSSLLDTSTTQARDARTYARLTSILSSSVNQVRARVGAAECALEAVLLASGLVHSPHPLVVHPEVTTDPNLGVASEEDDLLEVSVLAGSFLVVVQENHAEVVLILSSDISNISRTDRASSIMANDGVATLTGIDTELTTAGATTVSGLQPSERSTSIEPSLGITLGV